MKSKRWESNAEIVTSLVQPNTVMVVPGRTSTTSETGDAEVFRDGPLCATCGHGEDAHFDTGDVDSEGKPDTGCMKCFRSGLAGTPMTRCGGFVAAAAPLAPT